jgi:hypothetical protein
MGERRQRSTEAQAAKWLTYLVSLPIAVDDETIRRRTPAPPLSRRTSFAGVTPLDGMHVHRTSFSRSLSSAKAGERGSSPISSVVVVRVHGLWSQARGREAAWQGVDAVPRAPLSGNGPGGKPD